MSHQLSSPGYFIKVNYNVHSKNRFRNAVTDIAFSDQFRICPDPKEYYEDFARRVASLRMTKFKKHKKETIYFSYMVAENYEEQRIEVEEFLTINFVPVIGYWAKNAVESEGGTAQ